MNSSARCFGMIANAIRSVSTGDTVGEIGSLEAAVDTDERRRPHLDVDVRRAALDGVAKQLIQIQHRRDLFPGFRPCPVFDRHAAGRPL